MSAAWKRAERQAARALDGKRNSRGGDFSMPMPDVEHPLFVVEVKYTTWWVSHETKRHW